MFRQHDQQWRSFTRDVCNLICREIAEDFICDGSFQLRHDSLVTGQWPRAASEARSPAAVTGGVLDRSPGFQM